MKSKEIISEINLGNYVKKATQSKALSQMDKAFGYPGDHDRKIANREKGLMRAKRKGDAKLAAMRSREEPKANPEELKAKLDKLKSQFDPNYEYSDDYSFWSRQKGIADQIRSIERQLKGMDEEKVKEMGPTTPGTTTGKIEKIDTVKKVAVVANPDGTKEEKPLTSFQPDPKDPTGKTLQTTSAAQDAIKPGTQVNIKPAVEEVNDIKKLAGL